jgi:hypothetical protein
MKKCIGKSPSGRPGHKMIILKLVLVRYDVDGKWYRNVLNAGFQ